MRSSIFLASAFAANALAKPILDKRAYYTEVTFVTVTLYVTPGQELPTVTPAAYTSGKPQTTTSVVYVTPSSSPVYVPPPSSSAAPVYSSPAPVYSAPASSSAAPVYTPPASSAAPISSAAPVSSQVETAAAPAATGYEAVILRHHNVHRANHSASDLTWNQTLADAAYSWASQCKFQHFVENYGQNLAASLPNANVSAQLSEGWYNGEAGFFAPYYGIANPEVSEATFESYGHFTQMVWKNTQSVGCATYDCRGASGDFKMWYTVCNYYPAGNYGGEYAKNIGEPLGHATANWDS